MTAPTIRSQNSAVSTASGGNLTVNAPASIVAGDLLLAIVSIDKNAAQTAPTGWTLYHSETNGNGVYTIAAYYKIATGSEPSTYVFNGVTNCGIVARILSIAGGTTPEAFSVNAATNTTLTANAVTTIDANCLVFFGYGFSTSSAQTITLNGSLTTQGTILKAAADNTNSLIVHLQVGTLVQATAGSTGSQNATGSANAAYAALGIAVPPAPATGNPGSLALLGCGM